MTRHRIREPGHTTRDGYGHRHQQLRKRWVPIVATGRVYCWRCKKRIWAGEKWHLGHDDHDRRLYRGPEHQACNCATARKAKPPPAKALEFFA